MQEQATSAVTPLTVEQRAELKQLAEAATPGPWALTSPDFAGAINTADDKKHVALANIDSEGMGQCMANAAYIAAAHPGAMLTLLAALATAEAKLADISAVLETEPANVLEATIAFIGKHVDLRATATELREENEPLVTANAGLGELLGEVLAELNRAYNAGDGPAIGRLIERLQAKAGPNPVACPGNCLTCEKTGGLGEIVGFYEVSGLPVRDGDDYVTDVEGCYLTRAEANALAEEDGASPLQGKKGGVADV